MDGQWVQFRSGLARFKDGWNVVISINGKSTVFDPTYATEAEAEAQREKAVESLRTRFHMVDAGAFN